MADLVYRYLIFWVRFQLGHSEKGLYIAFDSSENLQKGQLSTQIPLQRSMVESGKSANFRELNGIVSSYRISHWRKEKDRLASGVSHARSFPQWFQGSSRPQTDRWWRRWSPSAPRKYSHWLKLHLVGWYLQLYLHRNLYNPKNCHSKQKLWGNFQELSWSRLLPEMYWTVLKTDEE